MDEMYQGLDNHGRPRKAYLEKLAGLTDQALMDEAEDKIWLSAWAANNPRSDYHWQCRACFEEAGKRGKPQIYQEAYNEAAGITRPEAKQLPKIIPGPKAGELLPVQVLKSAAGYYLGTLHEGMPYSRESQEYWPAKKAAGAALKTGNWSARRNLDPPPIEFTGGLAGPHESKGKRRGR